MRGANARFTIGSFYSNTIVFQVCYYGNRGLHQAVPGLLLMEDKRICSKRKWFRTHWSDQSVT